MIVPFLLFVLSCAGVAVAVILPGMTDLLLLAGPCALASLFLLVRAPAKPKPEPEPDAARWNSVSRAGQATPEVRVQAGGWIKRRPAPRWVVIDGSNVMHWKDGTPQIETLQEVVARLTELGFAPGVVFDANAGYKISGRYQHDWALGKELGLPEDRVMVVPKGTRADPWILAAARDLGARIVTNDRYRDWAEAHPEVSEPGHLIRGGYRDGALWLEVER